MNAKAGNVRLNGNKLREARARAGLSRERLADLSSGDLVISAATIKRAEKGRAVHLGTARSLARLLGLELEELRSEQTPTASSATQRSRDPHLHPPELPAMVGRQAQLEALLARLTRAGQGRPALVLLGGEAGIGKTRLARELCVRAQRAGGRWYWGQGHEHGAYTHQPFVEALASYELKLASLADEDARILQSLVQRGVPAAQAAQQPRGDEAWTPPLQRAVFRALTKGSRRGAVVLVIDDLQWVDPASVELFESLVFQAAEAEWRQERCPLMLVGIHRPADADSRLVRSLARLARETICTRLDLEGLDEAHTFELVAGLDERRPSQQLVHALHTSTGGNPLFVQEALRYLKNNDGLRETGGALVGRGEPGSLRLPESLTDALVARCRKLDRSHQRVLVHAACLGSPFELSVLGAVLDEDEEDILDRLEDAMDEGLLDSRGQRFYFSHPLVRQVFYQLPSAARRERMHKRIAERLESYEPLQQDRREHEIATHFLYAGSVAEPARVLQHVRPAAEAAFARGAWNEAGRFHATAAQAAQRLSYDDAGVAHLHYRAGVAYHRAWDLGPALEQYEHAERMFARAGDAAGELEALKDRVRLMVNAGRRPDLAPLRRGLERLGAQQARLRAHLMFTLCDASMTKEPDAARELAQSALSIATELGDDSLASEVSTSVALCHLQQGRLLEALDAWQTGLELGRRAKDRLNEARSLMRIPVVLYQLGRLDEADQTACDAAALMDSFENLGESSVPLAMRVQIAVIRGDFSLATRLGRDAINVIRRSGFAFAAPMVLPALASIHAARGQWGDAARLLDALRTPGEVVDNPRIGASAAGRYELLVRSWEDPAQVEMAPADQLLGEIPTGEQPEFGRVGKLCLRIELADRLGAPALARGCGPHLTRIHERGARLADTWPALIQRLAGVAAALEQDWHAAIAHLEAAQALALELGLEPELGRARLDHARALLRRGRTADRTRAIDLAGQARTIFDKLQMAPFASQAAKLGEGQEG